MPGSGRQPDRHQTRFQRQRSVLGSARFFPRARWSWVTRRAPELLMSRYLFTSESVTEGHPDKVSDAVSDAVLDAALAGDKTSRVACETLCKTGFVVLAGEITTKSSIDFGRIARQTIKDIGYTHSAMGFDSETCGVLIAVEPQSPDI